MRMVRYRLDELFPHLNRSGKAALAFPNISKIKVRGGRAWVDVNSLGKRARRGGRIARALLRAADLVAQEAENLLFVWVSPSVDFAGVALSCGYSGAALADDPHGFAQALAAALANPGPHLIHVRIRPGSVDSLGRPTLSPRDVADRFKAFLFEPNSTAG